MNGKEFKKALDNIVKEKDIEALGRILTTNTFERPTIKISVYKNRRGQYKDILLWCKANRATCKIIPMFATDYQYKIVDVPELKIKIILCG
mgnify:CR=1 FL=1